jgi:hypothetical protein
MLFGLAVLERNDAHVGSAPAALYRSDPLPELQSLLAALADIETCYEIACERLEQGAGMDEQKQRLRAELEAVWHQDRAPIVLRLAQLQSRVAGSR